GVACHVLIDGWRTVSPRFVFEGYDDAVQGEFVRPYLDADDKLPGRMSALLVESADGLVLIDAGNGRFAPDLDAGHVHEALDTVEGDARIATGIDAIEAPGHTPGHLAIVVNDAVLWAGDTFVSQLNVPHPEWVSLSDMDGRTNEATRRRLLERAAAADLLLAASHMPISGTVAQTSDGYELLPSERS